MIGYLRGMSYDTGTQLATVLVGGTGYEIHTSEPIRNQPDLILWIHEHAPQDAPHELYGFRDRSARDLFRRLLDVKGVGPKVGMRIVASGAVAAEGKPDLARLTSVRGVGTKLIAAICEAFT